MQKLAFVITVDFRGLPCTVVVRCILHFLKRDLKLFLYVNLKGMKIMKIILKKDEL